MRRVRETHVHQYGGGSMWLVEGSERCLLVETGTGVAPLRRFLESVTAKPITAFASLGYYDHAGVQGLGRTYRSDDEVEEWLARDPIDLFEDQLAKSKVLSKAAAKKVHEEIQAEVDEAIEFAENSPWPDPATDLLTDVYTEAS